MTTACNWMQDELHELVMAAKVELCEAQQREVEDEWLRLEAVGALFERFEGLLRSIAIRYRTTAGFDEAYQEAAIAFLVAITDYDATLGPFPAFAGMKVRSNVRTAMRRLWRTAERTKHVEAFADEGDENALDRLTREAGVYGGNGGMGLGNVDGSGGCLGGRVFGASLGLQEDVVQLFRAAELSPRELFWLRGFMAGYQPEEIARIAKVSVESVKTWRKRALAKLRRAAERAELAMCDFV